MSSLLAILYISHYSLLGTNKPTKVVIFSGSMLRLVKKKSSVNVNYFWIFIFYTDKIRQINSDIWRTSQEVISI